MSGRVVSLAEHRAAEARREDFAQRTLEDGPALAVQRAAAAIARELGRLDLHQRIAIEAALWRLLGEVDHRDFHPW